MTIRLHGFARGLLSLVGAQNFGSAPNELGDVILPTVDVSPMFQASKASYESLSFNPPIVGITTVFTVPTGEMWILEAADVRMSAGVGESVTGFGLCLTLPSNAALMASEKVAVVASTLNWATLRFPGIVLNAGNGIGYFAEGVTGAVDGFITIRIVRLTGA